MAEYTALAPLFTDIANAIRSKTGETGAITANNFPQEINNISNKEIILAEDDYTLTVNTNYAINFDVNYTDVLSHPDIILILSGTSVRSRSAVGYIKMLSEGNNEAVVLSWSASPNKQFVFSLPMFVFSNLYNGLPIFQCQFVCNNLLHCKTGYLSETTTRNTLWLNSTVNPLTGHYKVIMR